MGKRTKFQQKELAQLLLKVERNATSAGGEEVNQTELVSVGLTSNDLPKVSFNFCQYFVTVNYSINWI